MKKAPSDPWGRRLNGANTTRIGVFAAANVRNQTNVSRPFTHQQHASDVLLFNRHSQRQQEDLRLSITNVPTAGMHPFTPTVPKIAPKRQTTDPHSHTLISHNLTASRNKPLPEGEGEFLDQILSRPPTSKPAPQHHDPLPPINASDDTPESTTDGSSSEGTDEDDDDEFLSESDDENGPESSIHLASEEADILNDKSAPTLSDVGIPPLTDSNQLFATTIIQDHAYLDALKYSASVHPSGLGSRIDNIVRGFEIRGPLNKDILSRAINAVARKHPLLTVQFYRRKNKLYARTNPDQSSVTLDTPVFSGEKPMDAVVSARRQLFVIPVVEDTSSTDCWEGDDDNLVENGEVWSLVSLQESEGLPPVVAKNKDTLPSRGVWEPHQGFPDQNIARLPHIHSKNTDQDGFPHKSPEMEGKFQTLMRCKLLTKSHHEHYLILSFPPIVGDYWSSALFVQQLADAYAQIEKVNAPGMQRPLQKVGGHLTHHRGPSNQSRLPGGIASTRHGYNAPVGRGSRFPRLSSARPKTGQQKGTSIVDAVHFRFPAKRHFMQIAMRESQHLLSVPKEKLWSFWESTVTVVIRRKNGPPRIKVVPPVRLPSKLGDFKLQAKTARPKTSRLRPATARFLAGKEQGEGISGLSGQVSQFHFIRIEESTCVEFRRNFPEESVSHLKPSRLMRLMTLAAFVVMLGKCCRGWGKSDHVIHRLRGQADGCSGFFNPSKTNVDTISSAKILAGSQNILTRTRVKTAKPTGKGKLDLGSFLLGVEISARDLDPENMEGLFAPLTNDVALRVNLSSCERFVDLMVTMEKQLQMAAQHAHYPFKVITEELGLVSGLPIKFSFLSDDSVFQITNPDAFYFIETAVGVEGQALARLGSSCYLQPLNGKFSDTSYFELILWELGEGAYVGGGFRYHSSVIRSDLVEQFGREYCRLLREVARDPSYPLTTLARNIQSPFSKHK